ncbi:hypothetical protein MBH78_23460 [Oceanimonas sp. NS1]|nr:hypothetical protein [Oceanimonas sp. NS1]
MTDAGDPEALLPRLRQVTREYQLLVNEDPASRVLGEPDDYYRCYHREEFEALASRPLPDRAQTHDDWMIPLARQLDASQLKFPLILVQEYGWSLFRMAATATQALSESPLCDLRLNTRATRLEQHECSWHVQNVGPGGERVDEVDFLVNACRLSHRPGGRHGRLPARAAGGIQGRLPGSLARRRRLARGDFSRRAQHPPRHGPAHPLPRWSVSAARHDRQHHPVQERPGGQPRAQCPAAPARRLSPPAG